MEKEINISDRNLKNAYAKAYKLACERLMGCDSEEIASKTGTTYDNYSGTLKLQFMSDIYQVNCQDGDVVMLNGDTLNDTVLKTLLLHYLTSENSMSLTGKHISFSEIPGGGAIYDNAYQKRVIKPLIKTFGYNIDLLREASNKYGGKESSYGDISLIIPVFPFIPITYVIWRGDEEFSPSATILFDESVSSYLPVEDIVIMASISTYALIKEAKTLQQGD